MSDDVEVTLSHPRGDKNVGDRITVDRREARRLANAGLARPATKPEARKAGLDPDSAATAK